MYKRTIIILVLSAAMLLYGCGNSADVSYQEQSNKANAIYYGQKEDQSTDDHNDEIESDSTTESKKVGSYNSFKDLFENAKNEYRNVAKEAKEQYRNAASEFRTSLKEGYDEMVGNYSEILNETDFQNTMEEMRESYTSLYGEYKSLVSSLDETKNLLNTILSVEKKNTVQNIVDSVEDAELKKILSYALVIKDLKTSYSDYSVKDVTPEFKESMDSIERTVIELIELNQINENTANKEILSEYRDLIESATNMQFVNSNHDNLSEADREYFDIVMLRIVTMLFAEGLQE